MTTQLAAESTVIRVIGGVDTHKHTHYAAVVDDHGRFLGHREFPANDRGYQQLLAWLQGHGAVVAIGVESTGSFGATLTRFLTAQAVRVVEVNRANRLARRMDGKSDRLDAEQIARAGVMIGAPSPLRDELVVLTKKTLVNRCLRLRPESDDLLGLTAHPVRMLIAGVKLALRDLARRWKQLDAEIKALNKQIDALVRVAAPELVELHGVGVEIAGQFLVTAGDNPERIHSEAAFAKLCGVAPQPASSGRTSGRHRLSRGGDRAANSALYIITIVRMRRHQPTLDYIQRRTAEGLSKREIIRCLKRYIAREIYTNLPRPTHQDPAQNPLPSTA
ncbi:IS110 family transposase [Actinopolymorpha pittospori]|uniref:Transposase n=1 Tax=Actinopolymorpha pittospori TaxID=648752 RepID=A0A927N451_9ACTN|nr:transposase [Actinopolymorpha pittospori]MBE1608607.1 transposase [Actinopolymorpha pittospori]